MGYNENIMAIYWDNWICRGLGLSENGVSPLTI